jgi:mannose-1-phosphate guanylyltransferase
MSDRRLQERPGAVRPQRWTVILAGGDGQRLKPLTRALTGDDRPKQFCPVLNKESLLDQTRRRASLIVPPHRALVVVTRSHERFYTPALRDLRTRAVVAQPENRGTAPAILYALLRIQGTAPQDLVAFLPSDHWVSDDDAFMAQVDRAFDAAAERADLVTLLGIAPERPEGSYGWIEPGEAVALRTGGELYRVRRFWEKPGPERAEQFHAQGWFWNSFVMVGRVATLAGLVKLALPALYEAFTRIRPALGTVGEAQAAEALYLGLPPMDFSAQVLAARPGNLAVLPIRGVGWSDLGDPTRVLEARSALALRAIPELVSA